MRQITKTAKFSKIIGIKMMVFLPRKAYKTVFQSYFIIYCVFFPFQEPVGATYWFSALIWEIKFECNKEELKASPHVSYALGRRIKILGEKTV